MTKFEEWFENFNRINSGEEDKDTAELAWIACKNEILKILKENKIHYSNAPMFSDIENL